jgi:hypothetical protein
MTDKTNPWAKMDSSSRRLVDPNIKYNLFWVTDLEGKYGLCLSSNSMFTNLENIAKLRGIDLLKRNFQSHGELYLVLSKKEDWQIFHTLCLDLISVAHSYDTDKAMVSAVEVRLKRWQRLLKQDRSGEMTLERQMGLFSELSFLYDILEPKIGIKQAITSWVGADYDKQDFLLKDIIAEIKSHKTSSGASVSISSLDQLFSDKEPLYLVSYSLTETEEGETIGGIVQKINKLLEQLNADFCDIFEEKLIQYGFIPEMMESKQHSFIVDKIRAFHVKDDFPKITHDNVKSQVTNVKYRINLNSCSEYEIARESIFRAVNSD